MIKAINQYLADKGISVTGNTDQYYRLGDDGIKAWYVKDVPEPTLADLASLEARVFDLELLERAEQEAMSRKQQAEEQQKRNQMLVDCAKMPGASQVLKDEAAKHR